MGEPQEAKKSEKRKERAEYYARKEKLMAIEKENYDKIIFLKGTGGFWIVGGHSAVILANKIGKELKIRVPLKKDTDFDFRFKEGKVAVKNLDYYKRILNGSKMAKLGSEDGEFLVFDLTKKVGKEEYELLANMKEIRRQQLEREILKNVPMPKSHMHLTEATRITFKIYSKYTDKNAREAFGAKLMDEMRVAHKVFLLMCMSEVPLKASLVKIHDALTRALAGVTQMAELDLWTVEDATAVSGAIVEAMRALEGEERMAVKMLAKLNEIKAGGEAGKN